MKTLRLHPRFAESLNGGELQALLNQLKVAHGQAQISAIQGMDPQRELASRALALAAAHRFLKDSRQHLDVLAQHCDAWITANQNSEGAVLLTLHTFFKGAADQLELDLATVEKAINEVKRLGQPCMRRSATACAPATSWRPTAARPVTKEMVRCAMERVAKRAGLEDRISGWHIGRHTFATHLAMLGVNPWDLNQWMGHTRMEETLRYADVARAHGRSIPPEILAVDEDEADPQRRILAQLSARLALQPTFVAAPLQQKGGIPKWNAALPRPYLVTPRWHSSRWIGRTGKPGLLRLDSPGSLRSSNVAPPPPRLKLSRATSSGKGRSSAAIGAIFAFCFRRNFPHLARPNLFSRRHARRPPSPGRRSA